MEAVSKFSPPLLNNVDTINFVREIKIAFTTINYNLLHSTVDKYQLKNNIDIKEFLSDAQEVFLKFNNSLDKTSFSSVTPFNTNCIACSFGSKVDAYKIEYEKRMGGLIINYEGSFAIRLEIKNHNLTDIAFCNAFLSEKDIQKL